MPRKRNEVPKYTHHKATGQARVRISGKSIYLGPWQSPKSLKRYAELLEELAGEGTPVKKIRQPILKRRIDVRGLVAQYQKYLDERHRRRDGDRRTSRKGQSDRVLARLVDGFGSERAEEFGPRMLAEFRAAMVRLKWTRIYINKCVRIVVACWKWAAGLGELVSAECANRLALFPHLGPGESDACESRTVPPALETSITLAMRNSSPVVAAMIELQLLTGMRPGEVCNLRPADVDRSGVFPLPDGSSFVAEGIWVYRPVDHKTAHRGHSRLILIGPKGQAVLTPFLEGLPDAPCFRPADSVEWWMERRRKSRVVKMWPSHAARAKGDGKSRAKSFTSGTYHQSINHALGRASRESGQAVVRFHPHQLRHNAASRIAAEFSPEIARIVLGHRSLGVTRIYVADDLRKAAEAMRKAG